MTGVNLHAGWRIVFGLLAVVLALMAPIAVRAQAPEWTLPALMATMRTVRSSTARFVETRYFQLLSQAQRSSGRLNYVAPGYLRKETIEPRTARLTVSGDRLTIEQQGERTRDVSLREHPEIGALVESIRATLAGDLPALTFYFNATLRGTADDWALTLVPKEAKLRDMVATIRIVGARGTIRDIQTQQADGDRADMAVMPDTK